MKIEEVDKAFKSGDVKKIEMMARKFLCNERTHEMVRELSLHSDKLNKQLMATDAKYKDYLSLVFIFAKHLEDVRNGKCPCSIVQTSMFNCPSRLEGILEVLDEKLIENKRVRWCLSKCTSCGTKYESKRFEYGHGERVTWELHS